MSQDFEDLIDAYSNTNDINNVIQQSYIKLRKYLITKFKPLYSKKIFKEALMALLPNGDGQLCQKTLIQIKELPQK